MRILIVEDDADCSDMLQEMLERVGHQVTPARNGIEGWEKFQLGDFSVLISDWAMPGLGGIELCRRVRAAERQDYCYIILLTALTGKSNYIEAMKAGADDFISKPFDPDELKARLIAAERIVRLKEHLKRLEGVLPTCMYCKKIRDDSDAWVGIEEYISKRTEASFTHGVCPDCYNNFVQPQIEGMKPGRGN
jgi:phosphoserine phosphatase RsbU/P